MDSRLAPSQPPGIELARFLKENAGTTIAGKTLEDRLWAAATAHFLSTAMAPLNSAENGTDTGHDSSDLFGKGLDNYVENDCKDHLIMS